MRRAEKNYFGNETLPRPTQIHFRVYTEQCFCYNQQSCLQPERFGLVALLACSVDRYLLPVSSLEKTFIVQLSK